MSRAAWAGLLLLGAGLGLAAFLLTRGIDPGAVAAAESANKALVTAEKSLEEAEARFEEAVKEDPALLADRPEIKAGRAKLAEQRQALAATADARKQLATLVEGDHHRDTDAVLKQAGTLASTATAALAGIDEPAATARKLLGYKTNHDALLTSAREQITAAQALLDDAAFFERIELAGTSYPDAKVELDKRRDALQAHARQIVSTGGKLEAVAAAQPPQYIEVGSAAEAISTAHGRLVEMKAELESDLASLQTSIDRVLIDMKEDGGRYYHKYRVIENGASRETDWQEVTRSVYQQHREHLGMAIYSKPEGKLASQAETIAAPPGYAYVGNTRYGYWEQRNGQSFWVFYGKYALMRDLLWGPGRYRPVIQGDYRTYRRTVSSGQSWFGKNKEFGSKGTETKARYAGSKYFQQQSRTKYGGSQYQGSANRTAGRYSGSKYQGGAPSSGRYSGSRYSSSPSRSFSGSRGSRFRGSSFGGFGK